MRETIKNLFKNIKTGRCAIALAGSAVLAFGLYEVHSISGVTEGGALGLTLLLRYWFGISPALSGLAINVICYAFGRKILGRDFLVYSAVSALGFSLFYGIFEHFPRFWPELASLPLRSAVIGAVFVGVGAGLCVTAGGAPTGDDALAMGLSHKLKIGVQWAYLISDLAVLALSLTYIPYKRIVYSLLTVVLSGQIIGLMQKLSFLSEKKRNKSE